MNLQGVDLVLDKFKRKEYCYSERLRRPPHKKTMPLSLAFPFTYNITYKGGI